MLKSCEAANLNDIKAEIKESSYTPMPHLQRGGKGQRLLGLLLVKVLFVIASCRFE